MELKRLQELAAPQDLALERVDISQTRRRLLEGATSETSAMSWRSLSVLTAAAAVVAGLWLLWPRPLAFDVGGHALSQGMWWAAPAGESEPLVFADGTSFVLAAGTRVRVNSVTPHGAHLVVGSGSVRAHVQPLPDARWTVALGPYVIRVTGTVFEATWLPDTKRLEVGLEEGGVTILGPRLGTGLSLVAGERMVIGANQPLVLSVLERDAVARVVVNAPPPQAPPLQAPPTHASAVASAAPVASTDAVQQQKRPGATTQTPARWVALARAKRFKESLAAARAIGWGGLCASSNVDSLMVLADLARFGGDGAASRQALLALRRRFPGHPLAARAAFLLGRSGFAAQSGDWGAAWFSAYLADAPRGALAAEALGRLIEAHRGAGQTSAARAAATLYVQRYPEGPYAPVARDLIEEKSQ